MKKINFKNFKKETMYMLFAVVCLTITMISTSYSIFFDVKTNQNEQTVTTGSLVVQFTSDSISSEDYVLPYSDEEGLDSAAQSVFYVQNSGTTNGAFTFTIEEGDTHALSNEYIKLAIFDYTASSNDAVQISDIITLADCAINEDGEYILYSSTVNSGSTATYTLKFWLDEYSPTTIIGDVIDLEINVVSQVLESVMLYNISGTLSNSSGALGSATISLNNGSIVGTTDSNGNYTLTGVRSGVYGVTFTLDDGTVINDTIVVGEDVSVSTEFNNDVYTIYGGLNTNFTVDFTIDDSDITLVEAS